MNRVTITTLKNALIWGFFVTPFTTKYTESFNFYHLGGFAIITVGALVFNYIIDNQNKNTRLNNDSSYITDSMTYSNNDENFEDETSTNPLSQTNPSQN